MDVTTRAVEGRSSKPQPRPRDKARPDLLSIVCPAYNEEDALPLFAAEIRRALAPTGVRFEIVFVNDGSGDSTLSVMNALADEDPAIVIVDLSRNFGKEIATSAGLDHAAGEAVIVIDAGHGGGDPGAAGQKGTKESLVTLAAAKSLAEILRASGRYEVVLTRQADKRLAHEERSRLAREAKADLFISLHADAHANAKVRGGSVYTLSEEGTVRSAREAKASGDYVVFDLDIRDEDPQVGGILYNLAQRKTGDESDRFAERLIATLNGVTPMLNNTHRRGNFKVLLAPDVPAVLLELAFISNAQDEANLNSPAWRRRTMTAVAGAIDAYFASGGAARHAAVGARPVAGAP